MTFEEYLEWLDENGDLFLPNDTRLSREPLTLDDKTKMIL